MLMWPRMYGLMASAAVPKQAFHVSRFIHNFVEKKVLVGWKKQTVPASSGMTELTISQTDEGNPDANIMPR